MRLRHSWLSYSTVPCVLYTSRPHSKKPLSRRLLRSLSSMAQMLSRIVQFPISRWCQSYLSGLLHSNSTTIYNPLVFCRLFTSAYDRAARQKLLLFVWSPPGSVDQTYFSSEINFSFSFYTIHTIRIFILCSSGFVANRVYFSFYSVLSVILFLIIYSSFGTSGNFSLVLILVAYTTDC